MTTPTYAEAIGQATVDAMGAFEALPERFLDKIMFEPNTGCWLWMAARMPTGYGNFYVGNGRFASAHRYAYEQLVGPIPEGLEIDHLCHVRRCINPAHLEAVPHVTNLRRGNSPSQVSSRRATCANGHPWTAGNTYRYNRGRRCRICHAANELRRRHAG